MSTQIRFLIAGTTLVVVCALAKLTGPSYAGDAKDIPGSIKKIGALIKKGDDAAAKKTAAALAAGIGEDELGDLMHMFKPRNKGGLGVGEVKGLNPAKDGIEVMIRDFARDVPANVGKQAANLETTGYWIAALAQVTHAKAPQRDVGKKTIKAWQEFSSDMHKTGLALAKGAAGKDAQKIKSAASKVYSSCNNCHSLFKDF